MDVNHIKRSSFGPVNCNKGPRKKGKIGLMKHIISQEENARTRKEKKVAVAQSVERMASEWLKGKRQENHPWERQRKRNLEHSFLEKDEHWDVSRISEGAQ